MTATHPIPVGTRGRTEAARWLATPAAAAALVVGVWVTGGVITDDYKASMALTAGWFALSAIAGLVFGLRRRALLAPIVIGYVLSAGAVGGYLAWSTLHDRVVDEDVVTAPPADQVPAGDRREQNVLLVTGSFESLEHQSTGTASVIRLPDGERKLTLTDFDTSAGPDLRLRLVIGDTSDGGSDGAIDLGALKGNKGDQQYDIPARADLERHTTVVIWCRAFSAPFAKATLRRSI